MPLLVSWACAAALVGWVGLVQGGLEKSSATAAIANAWLLAALVSAAMGLLQYFGHVQSLSPWVSNVAAGEAYGNLRQRNQFATLCSIGLLALLWRVAAWQAGSDSGQQTPAAKQWLCWIAGLVLLACGNAASGSRTGLLQWWLVAGLGLMWWWQARRSAPLHAIAQGRTAAVALLALAVYLLCLWLLPWLLLVTTGIESGGLMGRFSEESGCGSRRILWANVLHLITLKPWLGWGWEELDYAHLMTLYPGARFCDILDNAHNLPLHLAVELGAPFAVVVCGWLCWLVVRGRPWQEAHPVRQLAWGVLAVIGLHSLVEYPLWYGPFQMAAGLSVWLLWTTPAHSVWVFSAVARAVIAVITIFLVAILAFTAYSYWRVSQLYMPQADRATAYQEDALGKLRGVALFRNQVEFAELTTTPLTADNAAYLHAQALRLLHFSPEPRVLEKTIESAVMLGRDDVAVYYLQRYRAAFPKEHALWAKPAAAGPPQDG